MADDLDPIFLRSKFLLRQKHFSISEKYYVWDESGGNLLFIERPAHFFRNLLAVLAALGILAATVAACVGAGVALPEGSAAPAFLIPVLAVAGCIGAALAGTALYAKRHVYFYRDDTRAERLLTIEQDLKWTIFSATYTVKDAGGKVLARLRKNYIHNLLRKRWHCFAPDGSLLSLVKEDSLIRALLRRFLGPFFGLLRTHFILLKGDSEEDVIGEFNRKLTLLDRYVLDMTADEAGYLDRRIALAIGVMLDTGERR